MSRHRNLIGQLDEAYEELDQEQQQGAEYTLEEHLEWIEENIDFKIDRKELENLLVKKFKNDSDAVIDHLIENKDRILKRIQEQQKLQDIKNAKEEMLKQQKPIRKNSDALRKVSFDCNQQLSGSRKNSIQFEEQSTIQNSKRKISQDILEIIEDKSDKKQTKIERNLIKYNSAYPNIENECGEYVEDNHLNLAIVGHVDSGKSTLVGQILYLNDKLDKKQHRKNEKQSEEIGKKSFAFAWAMDQREDERQMGVTIDVGYQSFDTKNRQITILDTPGHSDFIPNMINGAAQADCAIIMGFTRYRAFILQICCLQNRLVRPVVYIYGLSLNSFGYIYLKSYQNSLIKIDAAINQFEAGFQQGGQTKEHATLIKYLGVHQVIVCVNKMDEVDYNQQRFDEIVELSSPFFISLGFTLEQISFIPISGIRAENISTKSSKLSWYKQDCLIEQIDKLQIPIREKNKPTRITVTNYYESHVGKLRGLCISGKIEGGSVQPKQKLIVMPNGFKCQIKEILVNDEKVKFGTPGQNIECSLSILDNQKNHEIKVGNIICNIEYPIPIAINFETEVITFELQYPILKGAQVTCHFNSYQCPGQLISLLKLINKADGSEIKKKPQNIKSNQCALVEVQVNHMLCLELFRNIKAYGRVTIREKQKTLAVGIITKIK